MVKVSPGCGADTVRHGVSQRRFALLALLFGAADISNCALSCINHHTLYPPLIIFPRLIHHPNAFEAWPQKQLIFVSGGADAGRDEPPAGRLQRYPPGVPPVGPLHQPGVAAIAATDPGFDQRVPCSGPVQQYSTYVLHYCSWGYQGPAPIIHVVLPRPLVTLQHIYRL